MQPKVPTRPPRANILGTGVHAVNLEMAVEYLDACVESGTRGYVCVTGVHGVMEALRNRNFRTVLNGALLVTPDGMPTVWIGRLQKHSSMQRVFGPDLMRAVCEQSVRSGHTHFFYGGKPGVAEELKSNFERWYPGIRVLGTSTPPFRRLTHQEESDLSDQIAGLKPDIIWIGLSTPKQEMFMVERIHDLNCKLMIGVGAAFDFHTGRTKDAPDWIKNAGLQWLHRLYQEPGRLWKRYLVNNLAFCWHLALQAMGSRRYNLSSEFNGLDARALQDSYRAK
jgi:N-acetylglucosaminyldiphosphoundecaprenol N-acetyl-beta-D-mannosaminyltransferase